MRIVYLILACGILAVIGMGGAFYYVRNGVRPTSSGDAVPAHDASGSFAIPSPSVRTVAWYQAHPDQIKEKLATCNSSPGTAMHDPECFNAESAKENSDIDRFIKSAPKDAQPVVPGHK
jgi:hypothetical protein